MFVEFSHMEKKDFPRVILSNILEAFHLQGLCLMLGISALLITRPGRCVVCPNQSFRPPSWSSLPKVVDCLFVSPRHDGGGLVDLEVTVNLMSPRVVIAFVALIPWACIITTWGGLVVPLRLFLVILTLDVIPRPLLSRSSCTMSCHWAHRPVREKVQKGKTKHSPLLTYSSHLEIFLCETKRWPNSKYLMR